MPSWTFLTLSGLLVLLATTQVSVFAQSPFRLYLQGKEAQLSFGQSTGLGAKELIYDGRNGGGIGDFLGTFQEGGSLEIPYAELTFAPLPFNQPNLIRKMTITPISNLQGSIDFQTGQVQLMVDLSFEYRLDIGSRKEIARGVTFISDLCFDDNHGNKRCGLGYQQGSGEQESTSGRVTLVAKFQFEGQQSDFNYWVQDGYLEFPEFALDPKDCPSTPLTFRDFFEGEISMVVAEKFTYWYLLDPGSNNTGVLDFSKIEKGRVPLLIEQGSAFFAPIHLMAGVANASHVYFPGTQILMIQIRALKDVPGFIDICTGQVSYLYDTAFDLYIGKLLPYPPLSVVCDLTSEGGIWRNQTFTGERLSEFGDTRMIATATVPATGSPILDGILTLPNEAIANLSFHIHLQKYGWKHLRQCFCGN